MPAISNRACRDAVMPAAMPGMPGRLFPLACIRATPHFHALYARFHGWWATLSHYCSPADLALEQPGVSAMSKGSGVGAPTSMHCMKRPSRQPSAIIQSAVEVAATMRITVSTQHVKAITCGQEKVRKAVSGCELMHQDESVRLTEKKFMFKLHSRKKSVAAPWSRTLEWRRDWEK